MRYLKTILIFFIFTSFISAGFSDELRQAKIIDLRGEVMVRWQDKESWVEAKVGTILNQGDELKVGENSWALVNVDGEAEIALLELQQNSQVLFSQLLKDKKTQAERTLLDLKIGKILIKARKLHSEKSKFEIKTPTSVVGIRGTTFAVEVESIDPDQ